MGSKNVTSSYWYRLALHLGFCKGPIDALMEIKGGDRTAWTGYQDTSGQFVVYAPDLYGGEKTEGGIDGTFELMMGESDQMPNEYLAQMFGLAQPGYRGRTTLVVRGARMGAGNPYPKTLYFKLKRILKGWDNDVCWYPEKAPVPIVAAGPSDPGSPGGPDVPTEFIYNVGQRAKFGPDATKWAGDPRATVEMIQATGFTYTALDQAYWFWRPNESGLTYVKLVSEGDITLAEALISQGWEPNQVALAKFNDGLLRAIVLTTTDEPPYAPAGRTWSLSAGAVEEYSTVFGPVWMWRTALGLGYNAPSGEPPSEDPGIYYMNPAHILYDSITSRRENGGMEEPVGRINEASFTAAADRLYDEGFGLCCTWSGGESAEQFQQRILNVIGGALSQSRVDGQYYLDLLREVEDIDALPVITDADIVTGSWEAEPALPSESINQIQVKWFNPETREERITAPIQSLGAIQDAGGIYADVRSYYEIPYEPLALRVAQRDLQAVASTLWKFTFDCTRKAFHFRPGMQIRLMCPNRGFADVVVVVGDVDYGDFNSDAIKLVLLQDVFALPDSAYVEPQGSLDADPDLGEDANAVELVTEAPYIELLSYFATPEDFDATVDDTSGFLLTGKSAPPKGQNYRIYTKDAGGEYTPQAYGDFCPAAFAVGSYGGLDTEITIEDGTLLERLVVGQWGQWGDEIIRYDGRVGDVLTIARGCADTVPTPHFDIVTGRTPILFVGETPGTDEREYVLGEEVRVKLATAGYGQEESLPPVPEHLVEFKQRWLLPYPPADLKINGASIFTIGTPGTGGGGGGGGGSVPPAPPAQSPGGGPASPVPGPNGGYADDAPYPIPLPPSGGGEVVDDGGFDTPGYPTGWANKDGTPLDSRWFVDVDGKLHYQGVGSASAYYFPARFSIPWQPVPRYEIPVSADVRTDIGVTAAVGCTWGVSTYGPALTYEDVSDYAEYVVETTVPHSFIYVPPGLVSGLGYVDQIPIVNFVPVLSVHSDSALVVNATFDNVTVTPDVIPMPTTPEALTNLDFSSGLTGWTKYPDLTGNPYEATISVSGGELSMTGNSLYHTTQHFINDTPIALNDIGRYTLTELEAWCNDTTTLRGFTQNGVLIGIATKYGGAYTGVAVSGAYRRGDWTTIQAALRHAADGTVTPGLTLHEVISMRVAPGFTAKVRAISVATTDDIIDPVVL